LQLGQDKLFFCAFIKSYILWIKAKDLNAAISRIARYIFSLPI